MRFECAYKELVDVDSLIPHPSNRNKHPEKQVKALAKIIAKVGQRSPVVISNLSGKINKGHCRWEAIKLLGWKQIAIDRQDYNSELEEFNDRIADNEISRYSEFDMGGFLDDLKEYNLEIDDVDFEEFGKLDFSFKMPEIPNEDDDGNDNDEQPKKYKVEVVFENDMDMMDLYDDLISKGYAARVVK
jgi:hypothetical protein